MLYFDEAWFNLSGFINNQNELHWGTENTQSCSCSVTARVKFDAKQVRDE
jgi:hypothetical protein